MCKQVNRIFKPVTHLLWHPILTHLRLHCQSYLPTDMRNHATRHILTGVMIKNMSFETETHTAAIKLHLRTYINTNKMSHICCWYVVAYQIENICKVWWDHTEKTLKNEDNNNNFKVVIIKHTKISPVHAQSQLFFCYMQKSYRRWMHSHTYRAVTAQKRCSLYSHTVKQL